MESIHLSAPSRFKVQETAQQLSISFKLTRLEHYLGCIALLGFLGYVTYFMMEPFESVDAFLKSDLIFFFSLVLGVFGVAWLVLLSRVLNTITISTDKKEFKVIKNPLPFWDNYTVAAQDIAQLYVTQHKTSSYRVHYHLVVELKNGDYKYIVNRFMNYKDALFLERKIEDFLNIENIKRQNEYDPAKQ